MWSCADIRLFLLLHICTTIPGQWYQCEASASQKDTILLLYLFYYYTWTFLLPYLDSGTNVKLLRLRKTLVNNVPHDALAARELSLQRLVLLHAQKKNLKKISKKKILIFL